jgi:hypothetical protein
VSVANPPDGADAPPPATWTRRSARAAASGHVPDYLGGPVHTGDVGGDELVRGEVLHGVPADRRDVCPGACQACGHGGAGSSCAAADERALAGEILGLDA